MQFQVSEKIRLNEHFLLEKRGFKNLLILFPGFAFDYKIFSFLDLPFDYLYPTSLVTMDTVDSLKKLLPSIKDNFSKPYLLGWSLGANLALSLYKELPNAFRRLFLISIKEQYNKNEITELILKLRDDPKNMLKDFYRRCFLGKKLFFNWFKKNLEPDYLKNFSHLMLIRQLTYLENDYVYIPEVSNITIFYGKKDIIVPLSSIPEIPSKVKTFIFQNASHIPFLENDFIEKFLKGI